MRRRLQRAFIERSIASISDWARAQTDDAEVERVLREVRRRGYLVDRRPVDAGGTTAADVVDVLLEGSSPQLQQLGAEALAEAGRITSGYLALLRSLDGLGYARRPLECQLWALAQKACRELRRVQEAPLESFHKGEYADLNSVRIEIDGAKVRPDGYLSSVASALTSGLKMIGYRHGLFEDRALVLPGGPSDAAADAGSEAEAVLSLAALWRIWESTESRLRWFGGHSSSREEPADSTPGGGGETWRVVRLVPDLSVALSAAVAEERLERAIERYYMDVVMSGAAEEAVARAESASPCPLPPNGYLSTSEVMAAVAMSQALSRPIVEESDRQRKSTTRLFAGLTSHCFKLNRVSPTSQRHQFPSPPDDLLGGI